MGKLEDLLKRLAEAKAAALAQGLKPMATVAQEPVAVADLDEHNDDPASHPHSCVLNAVSQYHNALKQLARQVLEARYAKDVGEPCPPAPREWIIEKMARKYQNEQYMIYEGEIPASVQKYNRYFNMCKPRLATEDDEESDNDEPSKSERKFDPTMRAKALIGNPFSRGFAFELFALVEGQGEKGIQYNALVLLLKTMNDRDQSWAERKAQKVFTQWVDKEWVELI